MSAAPERIHDVYPPSSARLLDVVLDDYLSEAVTYLERTERANYDLKNAFAYEPISQTDRARIAGKNTVVMCLYFKAAGFGKRNCQPLTDEFGQILRSELERREHPMWEGTSRHPFTFVENYMKVLDADFGDWVPILYLARDLMLLEPLFRERGWVVIRMWHSSIAECPGAMWRYLCFNLPCNCCYIQDTDRMFDEKRLQRLMPIFGKNQEIALVRPLQWTSNGGEMSLILGNDFMVRPSKIDFDVARMMLGYIVWNILHEDRLSNLVHEPVRNRDDRTVSPMSKRQSRDHVGPHPNERVAQKNFPYYPFDEQWLKEFVYYHLSDGRMATLLRDKENISDEIQRLDLAWQQKNKNLLVSSKDERALSDRSDR